jgi:hypothetical protein
MIFQFSQDVSMAQPAAGLFTDMQIAETQSAAWTHFLIVHFMRISSWVITSSAHSEYTRKGPRPERLRFPMAKKQAWAGPGDEATY